MDPTLMQGIRHAAQHYAERDRDLVMRGVGIGFLLMLDAHKEGLLEDRDFRQGVQDLVALEREFSRV
jgi:hypothetical protein